MTYTNLVYSSDSLHWAWGRPDTMATFKSVPEDFRVDEQLGFTPDGMGEHVFWRVEKTGLSTLELVQYLSSALGIPQRSISYSGLKDKQAITSQWIGLHVGLNVNPDPAKTDSSKIRVLESVRNSKKLRRGVHRSNRFCIYLRDFSGDLQQLEERMNHIRDTGVPNYFGAQRFGYDGANAERARLMFQGTRKVRKRSERSILLSAARSWIFNEVLSDRVREGCWHTLIEGDVMQLSGSQVCFRPAWESLQENELHILKERLVSGDISITGPLWGRGKPAASHSAGSFEQVAAQHEDLCRGLEQAGLDQERRALILRPHDFHIESAPDRGLMIEFDLPRSGYATSVLRELVTLRP